MHGRSSSYLHEENVPSQRAAGWLRPSGHEESPQRRRHSMQRDSTPVHEKLQKENIKKGLTNHLLKT
jgi:hypothetical protein